MCGVCGNPSCPNPEDHEDLPYDSGWDNDPGHDGLEHDPVWDQILEDEYDQMLEDEYEAEHRREQRERRQRNELWERHEEEEFRDAMDAAEELDFFADESLLFPDNLPYDDLTPGRTIGESDGAVGFCCDDPDCDGNCGTDHEFTEEALFFDDLSYEGWPTLDVWRFRKKS